MVFGFARNDLIFTNCYAFSFVCSEWQCYYYSLVVMKVVFVKIGLIPGKKLNANVQVKVYFVWFLILFAYWFVEVSFSVSVFLSQMHTHNISFKEHLKTSFFHLGRPNAIGIKYKNKK